MSKPRGSDPARVAARSRAPRVVATRWQAGALVSAGVLLILLAAWWNSLFNGFNYDDETNIVKNTLYRGLGGSQLAWMFSTFLLGHYQPLAWLTLGADYLVWGMEPFGYHLTNFLLHAANTVFVLLLALTVLPSRSNHGAGAADGWTRYAAAGLAALLFGVHPLRVESVAWVTERRDVLSSFFLLLAVWLYLRAHQPRASERRVLWMAVVVVVYVLSLLSRAMGITLPVVLLILDWYPLRRLGKEAGGWLGANAVRVYLEKTPFVVLAVCFAALAQHAQEITGAVMPLSQHGPVERVAQACYGLVFYVWKTVLPGGLAPLYEIREPIQILSSKYIASAVLVVCGALCLWWYGRRWRAVRVAGLLYIVLLAPVLGLAQSGRQEVADRYSYLPAIGWAVLAGTGWRHLWHDQRRLAATWMVGAVCALGVLVLLTGRQCRVWHDPHSLWKHAARVAPSATTHQNLGGALAMSGRLADAVEEFQRSLALEPLHGPALRGLAKSLTDLHRWDEALPVWNTLARCDPQDAQVRFQLANVYRARGEMEVARQQYEAALRLEPDLLIAKVELGSVLLEEHRLDEAIATLRAVLAIRPDLPEALGELGRALAERGDTAAAIDAYRRALAARPNFAAVANNLGLLLGRAGRRAEALEALQLAVRTAPDNVGIRMNYAQQLERAGRREEAVAELQAILVRQPNHVDARKALESWSAPSPAGR